MKHALFFAVFIFLWIGFHSLFTGKTDRAIGFFAFALFAFALILASCLLFSSCTVLHPYGQGEIQETVVLPEAHRGTPDTLNKYPSGWKAE